MKKTKSQIVQLKAQLSQSLFNEKWLKEASKNNKPPGKSSAIRMDENQGFKRAVPDVKNPRQNPPKKKKRKVLQDTINLNNGNISYTNAGRNWVSVEFMCFIVFVCSIKIWITARINILVVVLRN